MAYNDQSSAIPFDTSFSASRSYKPPSPPYSQSSSSSAALFSGPLRPDPLASGQLAISSYRRRPAYTAYDRSHRDVGRAGHIELASVATVELVLEHTNLIAPQLGSFSFNAYPRPAAKNAQAGTGALVVARDVERDPSDGL